jgi:RNA polymerase II C-terminal domain phosphatase-like 1/2
VAYLEDGTSVVRPVVRLGNGLFLTRIDPAIRQTSMLVRFRPGWQDLRKALAGETADGKQRFDVYVCTAAERGYALEVWRLLDESGRIIPQDQRRRRITNVTAGRLKSLVATLVPPDTQLGITGGGSAVGLVDAPVLPGDGANGGFLRGWW